jgi:Xaa-Pro aminopeptidase
MKTLKGRRAKLLFADTHRSADQLYFGGVAVPDPFLSFGIGKRRHAILSRLEFNRVRNSSSFDEVHPMEPLLKEARKRYGPEDSDATVLTRLFALRQGIRGFDVPGDFPAHLAFELRASGLDIVPVPGSLFPQRAIKTPRELDAIRQGNAAAVAGFRVAEQMLRQAGCANGALSLGGATLTSERVREEIQIVCLRQQAIAPEVIVAGGAQACDPHCMGSGPLKPGELIIIDIFPRIVATGYHGDMTRTYLKGRATDAQRRLLEAVREAQQRAFQTIRAGRSCVTPYREIQDFFFNLGYKTENRGGLHAGFFHGLGHGLGLEVHEAPRMGHRSKGTLKAGNVVTVEPGLYYPEIGGARWEDVACVTSAGCEALSEHMCQWEIP